MTESSISLAQAETNVQQVDTTKTSLVLAKGVTKSFNGVPALRDGRLELHAGSVHALCGGNGAGKSTFLKLLSGEIEASGGNIEITPGERLAVLQQDHYAFDDYEVLRTVIMGHKRLVEIMDEKDKLYAKPDFSEEDGMKASELEAEFAELNGWDAESEAARLLNGLGIPENEHSMKMSELTATEKVCVLLAQALFGNPDILLLDEPTNHLDIKYQLQIMDIVKSLDLTVVAAVHDLNIAAMYCDKIAAMKHGELVAFGRPEEVLTEERIWDLYHVKAEVFPRKDGRPAVIFERGAIV